MLKTRIILLISAIIITVILFNLPKIVVENKDDTFEAGNNTKTTIDKESTKKAEDVHDRSMTNLQRNRINRLRQKHQNSENQEKSIIFADSLAEAYHSANIFDSAAYYLGRIAERKKTEDAYLHAADTYLEAFNFAANKNKRSNMAVKAREHYEAVLAINPGNTDAKADMALTYVTSTSPMKGITMLREILNEDPENQTALFNMGLLSITSGQIDKAIERFSAILEINDTHYEAMLYLGYCYMQTGETKKAMPLLENVVASDVDRQLKETAKNYLESIK